MPFQARVFPVRILFLLLLVQLAAGQALPPIANYQPREYQAENQNWGITQDDRGWMYFANNGGLLAFNGASWTKYPSPNGSVIRSVLSAGDRIYTGCYMEFGYWETDTYGDRAYHSLSSAVADVMLEDEQFWKIRNLGDWILFQSLQRIYAYRISDGHLEVIPSEASRAQLFTFEDAIFFRGKEGIYTLEGGVTSLLAPANALDGVIVGMAEMDERLMFITETGSFFALADGLLQRWVPPASEELPSISVYCSLQLRDGTLVLGTISQGVYFLGDKGEVLQHINKEKGLNNNTVLALSEDSDGNLWLALDNGISVINRTSVFREFNDPAGRLGVLYTAAVHRGYLYLGTNQGLFRRPPGDSGAFELIRGTEGQVWIVKEIRGTLFCGHNKGTFVISDGGAKLISDRPGTWNIKPIPGEDSLLLQGNYQGLSILEAGPEGWSLRNALPGFDISSRFFEFSPEGKLIVNHEYKGVYTLDMPDSYTRVSIEKQRPPWGVGASLFQFGNDLYYATGNALYRYSVALGEFELDSLATQALMSGEDRPVGILVPDPDAGRLWGFGNGTIHYLDPGPLDAQPVLKKLDVPSEFRPNMGVMGFECLTSLGDDRYLIGRSNGFVIFDLKKYREKTPVVRIIGVRKERYSAPAQDLPLDRIPDMDYGQGNITLDYNVPEYSKFREVEYQYRLLGYQDEWAQWSESPRVTFSNLPYGNYEFEVRARYGTSLSASPASYSFRVLRPWYATYWAMGGYLLGLIALSFGVNRLYKGYYQRQQLRILEENEQKAKRDKLKANKKIMEIQNARLQQEIDGKNRELAVSTMSLIKKNEFLNRVKDQLKGVEDLSQIRSVIRTIDRNINNEDDWKFFEEAFNNADKEFLHKVKELHPDLTPNDLKLCAYLRLNLSSKEIAPLLNISIRSVEVKRYRLRKKMGLEHEKSLTSYILEL